MDARSSLNPGNFYKNTWRHIPEESTILSHRNGDRRSKTYRNLKRNAKRQNVGQRKEVRGSRVGGEVCEQLTTYTQADRKRAEMSRRRLTTENVTPVQSRQLQNVCDGWHSVTVPSALLTALSDCQLPVLSSSYWALDADVISGSTDQPKLDDPSYNLSKISLRGRHTIRMQPYGTKVPSVQRDLRFPSCVEYRIQ